MEIGLAFFEKGRCKKDQSYFIVMEGVLFISCTVTFQSKVLQT